MLLNVTGKDYALTPAIKNHINHKFSNLEKRYHDINKIHVILRHEHGTQVAEANLHVHHKDINAIAKDKDLYSAVDSLVSKLASQLARQKNRLQDKRRHDQATS